MLLVDPSPLLAVTLLTVNSRGMVRSAATALIVWSMPPVNVKSIGTRKNDAVPSFAAALPGTGAVPTEEALPDAAGDGDGAGVAVADGAGVDDGVAWAYAVTSPIVMLAKATPAVDWTPLRASSNSA